MTCIDVWTQNPITLSQENKVWLFLWYNVYAINVIERSFIQKVLVFQTPLGQILSSVFAIASLFIDA